MCILDCDAPGCVKLATFAGIEEIPTRCYTHANFGQVRGMTYECRKCKSTATYGSLKRSTPVVCDKHKSVVNCLPTISIRQKKTNYRIMMNILENYKTTGLLKQHGDGVDTNYGSTHVHVNTVNPYFVIRKGESQFIIIIAYSNQSEYEKRNKYRQDTVNANDGKTLAFISLPAYLMKRELARIAIIRMIETAIYGSVSDNGMLKLTQIEIYSVVTHLKSKKVELKDVGQYLRCMNTIDKKEILFRSYGLTNPMMNVIVPLV